MNEAEMTHLERKAQRKKDRDMDFYTLEFNYFFGYEDGDTDSVEMEVYFDNNGQFAHFNCDFGHVSNSGDFTQKQILVALRDYLISLNLDNA